MSAFRITVVDADGAASFLAPAHALKMVAAACAKGAARLDELIERLGEFDPDLANGLREGLARFDADELTRSGESDPAAPFRLRDDATRAAAQAAGRSGLVVVNLPEKRIVQIQNTGADLQRAGTGRMRRNGRPLPLLYRYELPPEWRIVP